MSLTAPDNTPTPVPEVKAEGVSNPAAPPTSGSRYWSWENIKDSWERFSRGLAFVIVICVLGLLIWGGREAWRWVDRRSDQHAAVARMAEAMQLFEKKDFAGAIAKQREAIALWPDNGSLHLSLGQLLLVKNHEASTPDMQEYEAAYEIFCTSIRLIPDSVSAHEGAGICQSKLGNHAGAVSHLKEAVRLNPDSIRLRELLDKLQLDDSRQQRSNLVQNAMVLNDALKSTEPKQPAGSVSVTPFASDIKIENSTRDLNKRDVHANVKDVVVNQKHSSGILYDRLLLIRQLWTADQVPKVGTTKKDVRETAEELLRLYPKDSTEKAPEY